MEKCKKREKWMSGMKRTTTLISCSTIKTKIGWCAVVATGKVVLRIAIGFPERKQLLTQILKEFGSAIEKKPARMSITEEVRHYFSGKKVFLNCAMDWSSLSPFQQKVYKAAMKVPYGTVETYGNLARRIGCPKGARAVGGALSKNPFPLVVPCHRIVREDGGLGGFSARGGIALKKKLLKLEKLSSACPKNPIFLVKNSKS
jgi:methylated-DNA-[protein]-cysteine S-methyltransferase